MQAPRVDELDETYFAVKTANIRAQPTTNSDKVGLLKRHSRVAVTGRVSNANWLRIEREDGTVGYVFASLLAPIDPGELSFWTKVRGTSTVGDVEAFLREFPNGHFADIARRLRTSLLQLREERRQASERERETVKQDALQREIILSQIEFQRLTENRRNAERQIQALQKSEEDAVAGKACGTG